MERIEEIQKKLLGINLNEHTEIKPNKQKDLTYLSWTYAWTEVMKVDPTATYEVGQFADKDGVLHCYQFDPNLGYMVFTKVTIAGLTKGMWLPVMDNNNRAMKAVPYSFETKYGKATIAGATMFDINKTIMRCLVKNLAMFGLGTYIYAGEDLPFEVGDPCTEKQLEKMHNLGVNEPNVCKKFGVGDLKDLTFSQAEFVIVTKEKVQSLQKETK